MTIDRKTSETLQKMAAVTRARCETCPSVVGPMKATRCCDKFFCEVATITIRKLGGNPETFRSDFDPELPYMGPEGCRVPPTLRPVCTGYVCPHHLKNDPKFAWQWQTLQKKLNRDEKLVRIIGETREEMGDLTGAINRFRAEHPVFVDPDTGAPKPPEDEPPPAAA